MSQRRAAFGLGKNRAVHTTLLTVTIGVLSAACQQSASQNNAAKLARDDRVGTATSCPATNFPDFLKKFASGKKVQVDYTMPLVTVVDYVDPAGGGGESEVTATTQVPKDKYRGFNLRYERGAFHDVDSAGDVDPAPENVKIESKDANYFVHYIHGMSEGNSWLFKPMNGCWFLSEDPEPPME